MPVLMRYTQPQVKIRSDADVNRFQEQFLELQNLSLKKQNKLSSLISFTVSPGFRSANQISRILSVAISIGNMNLYVTTAFVPAINELKGQ
jgi:hypothetical protein